MKIKNSKNINFKAFIIPWFVAVIILVPVRFYQLLTIVDGEVGFYKNTDFTVYLMYALVAIFVIGFIAMAFLSKKAAQPNVDIKDNRVLGFFSIVTAILLLYNLLVQAAGFMKIVVQYSQMYLVNNYSLGQYLLKFGGVSRAFEVIFLLLSAIYFILFGVSCLGGKINVSNLRLLALSPLLWSIFRMLTKLVRAISYIRISDLFYEIIMVLFTMLFFMAFAQVTANVNPKGIEWKVTGYGLVAALMALVCNLPRLFMVLIGKADMLCPDAPVELWDIALAVFIVLFIANIFKNRIIEVEITDKKEIK